MDAGGNPEADVVETGQFPHQRVYLSCISSLWVKDRFGVVKEQDHDFRGQEWLEGCQILRIFDTRTDDLGELGEEIETGSRELITADESTVIAKLIFDPLIVENSKSYRSLPDPSCTDESEGFEVFCQSDNLLD